MKIYQFSATIVLAFFLAIGGGISFSDARTVILDPNGDPLRQITSQNATASNGVVTIVITSLDSPVTLGTLQLRDNAGVFEVSLDSGSTWEPVVSGELDTLNSPVSLGTLLLRDNAGTLELSTDEGETWDTISTGTVEILENPVNLGTLQLRDNAGVLELSTDSGSSWDVLVSGDVDTLANPVTLGTLQLRDNAGTFELSTDSGSTWEPMSGGSGTSDPTVCVTLVEPTTDPAFYQGMQANGSTDAANNPLAFQVADDTATTWREDREHEIDLNVAYFDEGTSKVQVQYYSDSGLTTKDIVTRTNTGQWKETTSEIRSVAPTVPGSLYLCSDTIRSDDPIVDTSTSAHTLTIMSSPVPYHDPLFRQFGRSSIRFPNGGYLKADPHADFNFGSGAFTIMLWFKTSGSGWQLMFTNNGNSANGWNLGLYNGELRFGGVDSTEWATGITGKNDNGWHHLCLCSDGAGTLYAYIDGADRQTKSYTSIQYDSSYGLEIGAEAGYPMNGWMEDIYVYNGTCLHTETSFTPPTNMLKHIEGTGGQSGMLLMRGFTSNANADFLLKTDSAEPLYLTHVEVTNVEKNAYAQWLPQ